MRTSLSSLCVSYTLSCDYPDAWVWISRLAVEIPGGRDGICHIFKHYLYIYIIYTCIREAYLVRKKESKSFLQLKSINIIW